MAELTTFDDLCQYSLRKVGEGVIRINITDEQLTDRVEEALDYWGQFSSEARVETYASHQITGSHLQLTTNVSANFAKGTLVKGNTSNAEMIVYDSPEINKIRTKNLNGTFVVGETITAMDGVNVGQTAIIAANGIFIGDIQNGYITLAPEIISVKRVVSAGQMYSSSGAFIFDMNYQISMKMLSNYTNSYLFDYYLLQSNLSLIDMMFGKVGTGIPFSRIIGRLSFDVDNYDIDSYIVMSVYSSLNISNNSKIYNDFWVKKYAPILVKKQWAENLGKYENVILPGGITVNASQLYEQAISEKKELEELLITTFSTPLGFFVG